jgi:hypothetical protein
MASSAIQGKLMQQGKAAAKQWMGRIYDLDLAQRLGWRVVESGIEVGDRLTRFHMIPFSRKWEVVSGMVM